MRDNSVIAQQNLDKAYKQDSDGDGVIDIHDKNPQMWDVSERDLRFFAAAAHSSENVNKQIFNNHRASNIASFNEQRLNGNTDISELIAHWDMLRVIQDSDGLQYAIYGNGKQANDSYKNIVIAFKGTNDATDWLGNMNIATGDKHPQANHLQKAADTVATYNPENLYTTGNSLGGYLAQYFATYTVQKHPQLAQVFRHSSVFNTAILKTTSSSPNDLKEARVTADEFLRTSIRDDNDASTPVNLNKVNSYVIRGEWLSGMLGSYDNTTFFNGTGSSFNKHNMNQFFGNNAQLEERFSRGTRIDKHYLNKDSDNDGLTSLQEAKLGTSSKKSDTDGDGFTDKLEAQLASNPLNSSDIPNFLDKININEIFTPIKVVVEGKNSQGQTQTKEVILSAKLQDNKIIYTLDPTLATQYNAEFLV